MIDKLKQELAEYERRRGLEEARQAQVNFILYVYIQFGAHWSSGSAFTCRLRGLWFKSFQDSRLKVLHFVSKLLSWKVPVSEFVNNTL